MFRSTKQMKKKQLTFTSTIYTCKCGIRTVFERQVWGLFQSNARENKKKPSRQNMVGILTVISESSS